MTAAPLCAVGARQVQAIRMAYLDAALRQDVTYYDVKGTTGEVLMGLNDDSATVQAAISERVGTFVHHFVTFVRPSASDPEPAHGTCYGDPSEYQRLSV